jgi:glycosyltransferase involved in cell wall biosynthesis
MKLAIVNEWMNVYGGAERKMAEILDLYPHAQLYALIHNPRPFIGTPLEGRRFRTSFMQGIPRVEDLYRGLLPLMPFAIESMNLRDHDVILSISHAVAMQKIRDAWGRDSQVIYPPVDVKRFKSAESRDDFHLFVSRLVPYKMTAEIIKAFNQLKLPLMIVGDGPDMPRLQRLAHENVKLLGYQPDAVVNGLMNRARGFVYMAVEDFGIAMVEAQAAGAPVIAHARGGAAEIVLDGETGLLFREQSAESMIEAVLRSQSMHLSSKAAQENAARFSRERFRAEFTAYMDSVLKR